MFTLDPQKATIILPLPMVPIPDVVLSYAKQYEFVIKPEIHLTIISFQNGKKLIQGGIDFQEVVTLAEKYSWEVTFLPEYFVLERTIKEFILQGVVQTPMHTRKSIIQKVDVPDLLEFFHKLSEFTGIVFEKPIAHVTLFSWSDYEPEMTSGIALNTQAQFDEYGRGEIAV